MFKYIIGGVTAIYLFLFYVMMVISDPVIRCFTVENNKTSFLWQKKARFCLLWDEFINSAEYAKYSPNIISLFHSGNDNLNASNIRKSG